MGSGLAASVIMYLKWQMNLRLVASGYPAPQRLVDGSLGTFRPHCEHLTPTMATNAPRVHAKTPVNLFIAETEKPNKQLAWLRA